MTLVRITARHFCAGLEVGGRYAPILAYMRPWSLERIATYCAAKGYWLEVWAE